MHFAVFQPDSSVACNFLCFSLLWHAVCWCFSLIYRELGSKNQKNNLKNIFCLTNIFCFTICKVVAKVLIIAEKIINIQKKPTTLSRRKNKDDLRAFGNQQNSIHHGLESAKVYNFHLQKKLLGHLFEKILLKN